ncbi:TnsA endonuclease N terminal [Celeribacter baekdonensis]|uniref:TnsA endonuclease N terminal n=1 Tax=Celeribacter baekdonensis TaxID=875171 RepID=A0A1G7U6V7_9RHOB|nr:Tn7 transposase TnsA N-terminal domain-containing protein [Celeribacter baekdonensis]SDG43144.1 TnsA endonuclease N terminal [Celeribacter baekdonensis]
MKNNLIYRGPEPSHATRIPARRSKGSLRGSMVAMLPGFQRPRLIHFESALEYAFLCLMLVRDDVHHIREQPPAISYVGTDGRPARHIFDFLVTKKDGERIAVAIKPMQRVLKLNFASELESVSVAVSKSFADRVLLVTDQHIDRQAAAEAARTLAWSRPSLTEVAA